MKKKLLSVILTASMLIIFISVNAVFISYEDIQKTDFIEEIYASEVIEVQNDEIYINETSPKAIDYGIMTTSVEDGTLEYVKTVKGNPYLAYVCKNTTTRYWSQATGYNSNIAYAIANYIFYTYSSYGSASSQYVPLFENIYLSKGSVIKLQLTGNSCGHVGSTANVYISNAKSSATSYSHSNQINFVGNLTIPQGDGSGTSSSTILYYTIHQSGYYTIDAMGIAYGCELSGGHGIYMNQDYYIYRYKYDISYNLNGGTLSKTNPTYYYEEDSTITLNNPTKTGYTFLGWTGSNGTTSQTNVTIPSGSMGNKCYAANWKINQYPVTYIDIAPDGEELGRTVKNVDWNTSVRGNNLGGSTTENAYYNGYYYVSDTSATVTLDGATVYRNFEATNINKEVHLNWNDNNNRDGMRPDKYILKLKQNGKVIKEVELPSSQTNYTFSNLPKYDSNSQKYNYSFDTSTSERYNIRFEEDGNLIVEDYLPASFSVKIPKTIILDGTTGNADYNVVVNGTVYYNDVLTVKPDASFVMKDINSISSIQVNITQIKTGFSKEDLKPSSTASGHIQVNQTYFSGSWKGSFNFLIKFKMSD